MSSKIALRLTVLGVAFAAALIWQYLATAIQAEMLRLNFLVAGWVFAFAIGTANATTYEDGISASPSPSEALKGTLTDGSSPLADLKVSGTPGTFVNAVYQPALVAFRIQSSGIGPNGDPQYGLGAPDNEAPGLMGAPGDQGAVSCGPRSIYDPDSETYLGFDGHRHPCP
jgi:hypothetical protein